MKPHKWAKEIKAWADGAEIQIKYGEHDWVVEHYPNWHSDEVKYRIKVETEGCKACVTCGQLVEQPQPKEPQYLYVMIEEGTSMIYTKKEFDDIQDCIEEYGTYIGKIKLEADDE